RGPLSRHLKLEPQRKLQRAWATDLEDRIEAAAVAAATRASAEHRRRTQSGAVNGHSAWRGARKRQIHRRKGRTRIGEVRVIEKIENFSPELKIDAFSQVEL